MRQNIKSYWEIDRVMKSLLGTTFAFLAVLLLAGCSSPQGDFVPKTETELAQMESLNESAHTAFINGNYEQASAILAKLNSERTVSRPLYQLEQLSALLMDGKNDQAHELMKKIHADLETLFDQKSEEKAQSIWHGEINKVFKGDSYERATFYAFMALSFISKGEYEDALRCVKNGLLADADSSAAQSVDDYALLHYIGYLAATKMNDKNEADAYLTAMKKALAGRGFRYTDEKPAAGDCFSALNRNTPNVLLVVWAGSPPTVVCTGSYKENRNIIRGNNAFDAMTVAVNSGTSFFIPNRLGDVEYQAVTRGGRLMDNVLADKAAAKAAMEVSGNILLVMGYTCCTVGLRNIGSPPVGATFLCIGLGCYVVGGSVHIMGALMNPAADGRFWRNLPAQLYVIPLTLTPGTHRIMLKGYRYSDTAGIAMFNVNVPDNNSLNVIHLPMMTQGAQYSSGLNTKHKNELNEIIGKANANRLAKEIK